MSVRYLKYLLIVSVLLIVGFAPHAASGRTLATVEETQTRIDGIWDGIEPTIEQNQLRYFNMTGRYFQGMPSHFSTPNGDTDGAYPDGWFRHPTDQQYRWEDFGIPFDKYPFLFWMDVYHGPEGPGYVTCLQVIIERALWEKCRNYGPEALRAHDWAGLERVRENEAALSRGVNR